MLSLIVFYWNHSNCLPTLMSMLSTPRAFQSASSDIKFNQLSITTFNAKTRSYFKSFKQTIFTTISHIKKRNYLAEGRKQLLSFGFYRFLNANHSENTELFLPTLIVHCTYYYSNIIFHCNGGFSLSVLCRWPLSKRKIRGALKQMMNETGWFSLHYGYFSSVAQLLWKKNSSCADTLLFFKIMYIFKSFQLKAFFIKAAYYRLPMQLS